ncbi:hypothetical protein D3869_29320 (plasmid) [Azospirillum brasilense]|uniref:Uncharacterized protein n=1 Tax=Azospirillum brasilense TaxID=192 RepID=A0A4D8RDF6_AZOBR|nr:hypothetical protein D3869_29320 [Azospirillum brasilense]
MSRSRTCWGCGQASLRGAKARLRPLFLQAGTAASAGAFLDGLLGPERRKTGWMRADGVGAAQIDSGVAVRVDAVHVVHGGSAGIPVQLRSHRPRAGCGAPGIPARPRFLLRGRLVLRGDAFRDRRGGRPGRWRGA